MASDYVYLICVSNTCMFNVGSSKSYSTKQFLHYTTLQVLHYRLVGLSVCHPVTQPDPAAQPTE